jgi:hypothetical protein
MNEDNNVIYRQVLEQNFQYNKQDLSSLSHVLLHVINKLDELSVRGWIKYMFWIIRVSQLSVQPHPHNYPG